MSNQGNPRHKRLVRSDTVCLGFCRVDLGNKKKVRSRIRAQQWETALGVGTEIGKPRPETAARLQWWEIPAPKMLTMTTLSESVETYCLKCRAKTPSRDVESVTMKNGRPALKGVCAECGTGEYRIGSIPDLVPWRNF